MKPKVYMVSAGPGDSKLLTLGAKSLLESADMIAYDDLIHPDILKYGSPHAIYFPIGYRGKPKVGPHPILHPYIVQAALSGKKVVRLKGGDASMFSRIYQEWEYLAHFGIEISIAPGVSAAFAAAAKAAIPLTRKGMSSQVSFEWCHSGSISHKATRVVYMPRSKITAYCRRLITMGYSSNTVAYFVTSAGTPLEQSYRANLKTLPTCVNRVMDDTPGIVIIGNVGKQPMVSANEQKHPLVGIRIVLLRLSQGTSTFSSQLQGAGADVIQAPLVLNQASEFCTKDQWENLDNDPTVPWVFTTPESVQWFYTWLKTCSFDIRRIKAPLVCIGKTTSMELKAKGLIADIFVSGYRAQNIDDQFAGKDIGKMIVFTGENSGLSPSLESSLSRHTTHLEKVFLYKSRYSGFRVVSPPPDLVLAPSSPALEVAHSLDFGSNLKETPLLALGESVGSKATILGFKNVTAINFNRQSSLVGEILTNYPNFSHRELQI